MNATLVFARHGETFSNVANEPVTDGNGAPLPADCFVPPTERILVDLNPRGMRQAELLSERLAAEFRFDGVVCSGLRRAVETLAPLRPHLDALKVPVRYTLNLREIDTLDYSDLGDRRCPQWHERLQAVVERERTEWIARAPERRTAEQFKFRGKEEEVDVLARAMPEINLAAESFPGGTVLILAHGSLNQFLVNRLMPPGMPQLPYGTGNTAVSVLEGVTAGRATSVRFIGCQKHLPAPLMVRYPNRESRPLA